MLKIPLYTLSDKDIALILGKKKLQGVAVISHGPRYLIFKIFWGSMPDPPRKVKKFFAPMTDDTKIHFILLKRCRELLI